MKKPTGKNRLLVRLVLTLLPACALPLLCLGYIAIKSHYDSLRIQSLASHRALVTFMSGQLDRDVLLAIHQVQTAAKAEVFKTQNVFMIRQALAGVRDMAPGVEVIGYVDLAQKAIAYDPLNPEAEGKKLSASLFQDLEADGQWVSRLYADEVSIPRFKIIQEIKAADGTRSGYLYADVSLRNWVTLSRAILRQQQTLIAALLPTGKGADPIRLNETSDAQFWPKVAALRSVKSDATEQEIDGEPHHVLFQDIDRVHTKLVLAQPLSVVYASPRHLLIVYMIVLVGFFLLFGGLIVTLSRSLTGRLRQVEEAATAIADGHLDARAAVKGQDELALLAEAFNRMSDSLQISHQRMRVLHKAIVELFACSDADSIVRKATELVCTQCQGETAWFLPEVRGHEVAYAEEAIFVGLHGWAWKNHRSLEINIKESAGVWQHLAGDCIFPFIMKNQTTSIGVLNVAYRKAPDEHLASLLHALISLVEMALIKQDQTRKGAMVSTELNMAAAVQRNIMSENLLVSCSSRVAYHYQPASRLGGDWFYLIEDQSKDQLYVVMGDVTGHGLAQGLVTTAVKGALDVIEHLLGGKHEGVIQGPADIVTLLETVVWRVAGPAQLSMTCLAAVIDFKNSEIRVCNAGHTFPILLRSEDNANAASHLSKNQQPLLGPTQNYHYQETSYPLKEGDMLVVYTDGLSEAKNLKSGIFGRFLFRGLKRAGQFESAGVLKDEILQMFRYYTQESRIDDDVCFLVVQVRKADALLELSA